MLPSGLRPPGSLPLLVVALLLVYGGGWLAQRVQTEGGTAVRSVRFVAPDGAVLAADLYLPADATPDTPAPGVLAVHGYLEGKGAQSAYAVEFARRGYVVLAIDQRGHGHSDPPAFAAGSGGPAGLAYLRSLPQVDPSRIALEGRSSGGWAVLHAAAAAPAGYASVILSGSSTGTLDAPRGTATFPRNLALIFGAYDEFAGIMWGVPTGRGIVATEKLRTLFGSEAPVEAGVTYGSIEEGTARWLAQPPLTHAAGRVSGIGMAAAIDWLQRTVPAPNPLPPADQVWYVRELGTGLGLLGMVLALFAVGGLLLRLPLFDPLERAPAQTRPGSAAGWWISALPAVAIPVASYYWLQHRAAEWLPVNPWFPQEITNGLAVWAAANGATWLALWLLWYLIAGRRGGAAGAGLLGGLPRSFGLAVATVGAGYLLLTSCSWIFGTEFRAWLVAVQPMSALQARMMLPYLLPFGLFFVASGLVLHGPLRSYDRTSLAAAVFGNGVLLGSGFAALLLVQYLPVSAGRALPFGEPLLTLTAVQWLVLLPVTGMLSTYFFRHTGRIWPGAFANTLFVAWYLVASQATHLSL